MKLFGSSKDQKQVSNFILVYVFYPYYVCGAECYAVLHLPVVEMEGDIADCSLSVEGEC